MDHTFIGTLAEVHRFKSEYDEAHKIQTQLLKEASVGQSPYTRACALVNIAEIEVPAGAPKEVVQRNIERAREIFEARKLVAEVTLCDIIAADLSLREGDTLTARAEFERCLQLSLGHSNESTTSCLERLGDAGRWDVTWISDWATVHLTHSLKCKDRLGVHKALLSLGDMFLTLNDEDTATTLFIVALDGFTQMDVHHSRAECMLRLGDHAMEHDNVLKAVELWETARPLFERSSQSKRVELVDERLAGVAQNVLEQHRKNLARLTGLNAPSGVGKEVQDEVSDPEDEQEDVDALELLGSLIT
jgi:hypothetical protein